MFNWLKRLFGFGKPALDPEIYGSAGGRVPYPPHEVIQERLRQQGLTPTGRKPRGPANQRIVGLRPLPGPMPSSPPAPPLREDTTISDLALLALLTSRREPDLDRPSAWPQLDEIKSGGGGEFGGGGASGSWDERQLVAPDHSKHSSISDIRIDRTPIAEYEPPTESCRSDSYSSSGSSDSGSSDSSSSSID